MERVWVSLPLSLSPSLCLSLAHIYLSTWPHPLSSSRDGGTGRIINYSRDQIICVSRCRGEVVEVSLPCLGVFFSQISQPPSAKPLLTPCFGNASDLNCLPLFCTLSLSPFFSPRDFLISLLPQLISPPRALPLLCLMLSCFEKLLVP